LSGNLIPSLTLTTPFFDSGLAGLYGYGQTTMDNVVLMDSVPEPGTLGLLATGIMGLVFYRRRRQVGKGCLPQA
jgi:hypothetical protein